MKRLFPEVQKNIQQAKKQIRQLAAYREDYIRRTGQRLSLKHTCHKRGMSSTTVKILAAELYENWDDIHFHWNDPAQELRDANAT
jgi:flagellar biosynthesis chaperone FliJ